MYAGLISIQIMGKNFHTGGDSDIVSYRNILRSDSIYFDITIDKNPGGGLRKFHPCGALASADQKVPDRYTGAIV